MKNSFPLFFSLLAAFLAICHLSLAQTYHEDDKEGLRMFLRQPSAIAGEINAQRLGLQLSDTLSWMTDEAWVSKVIRLEWNSEIPKRLISIEKHENNTTGWQSKNLAGHLDCSKWTYLSRIICTSNNLTSIKAKNCISLLGLYCRWNKLETIYLENCPIIDRLGCLENQLTTITIINCPNLEMLFCEHNRLSTFDDINVDNCNALNRIDCMDNLFTNINMNTIPTLTELNCSNNYLANNQLILNHGLQKLICNNNQITHLAPHSASLVHLECRNNNLVSLDVSTSPNLLHLDCKNNNLTSLELSNNNKLQQLYCENNQLTSLDISHNKNLQELYCDNNELITLDVSNATKLKELSCKNNQLTTLDVTDCHALTHLDCSNNLLTSITNIHNKSRLEELNCDNNQLTTLDVSNCIKLVDLSCVNNLLTHLDVTNCKSIVHLNCRHNRLNALNISSVGVYLHALDCSYNQMFFSGIPPTIPFPWEYVYWPQNTIEGGKIHYETGIDLSKEYLVEGNLTQFWWFDITEGYEQPIELPNEYGFFSLTEEHIGKRLRCKMLNATFPALSGNNILTYEVNIIDEVGIKEHAECRMQKVVVYPNPTTGGLTIEWTSGQVDKWTSVEVFDVFGRRIEIPHCVRNDGSNKAKHDVIPNRHFTTFSVNSRNEESHAINITHLPNGVYFIKITTEKGIINKKVIKQ